MFKIFFCFLSFVVHNWTLEDTLQWLIEFVELPQYEKNFRDNNVKGTTLPRWVFIIHVFFFSLLVENTGHFSIKLLLWLRTQLKENIINISIL